MKMMILYRAGRPVFFGTGLLNRFRFRTGLSVPVPFLNQFIGTGFYLGNRFKVNKKNINKRFKKKGLI